ncbi:hypothetical protein NLU13_7113 [Sarocladium strictum]|uniref:Zn(2)-C6 fungal-type domain-containing protein n=1 Tax=Sarocladium strictum TaxID=5046 RepID=A0AA39L6H5_SARSR|nr:hypothetical protein NLU13_7113 [Sarocladium strictum]
MVYSGKPSAACERCRNRRLRCNLAKPSCAACIRAKVECVGFRDQVVFSFRDQNEVIARKHHARLERKRLKVVSRTKSASSKSPTNASVSSPIIPAASGLSLSNTDTNKDTTTPCVLSPYTIAPQVQELARCYFYANHVSGSSQGRHLSFLKPIIKECKDHILDAAVSAVALAAFANIHASPSLTVKSQAEYAAALSKTNRALGDPQLCKSDNVLAAVMLLGMYEIVACTDDRFVGRWINHVDGAAKLLEVRGPEQLSTPLGLEIFRQLRPQIVMSNLCQGRPALPILVQLTQQVDKSQDIEPSIADELAKMGIKVARLHAHTKEGVLSRPEEVIKAALKVDAEIVSLLLEAQHPWRYRTVAVPNLRGGEGRGSFITWGGYYHVYDNITACAMWNNYRAIRIILQELIRDTIEQLNGPSENAGESPHHCSLAVECHKAIVRMVEDICASVPFCLGYEMTPEDGDGSRLVSCFPWVADGPVSGSGGLTLMWPRQWELRNPGVPSDQVETTLAVFHASIAMGLNFDRVLQAISMYAERNKLVHSPILHLVEQGQWRVLQDTLLADLMDIPAVTPSEISTNIPILQETIKAVIDTYFDRNGHDDPIWWTPKAKAYEKSEKLRGARNKRYERRNAKRAQIKKAAADWCKRRIINRRPNRVAEAMAVMRSGGLIQDAEKKARSDSRDALQR